QRAGTITHSLRQANEKGGFIKIEVVSQFCAERRDNSEPMRPDSSPGPGRVCLAVAIANDYKDATHMINEEPPVVRKKLAGWFWPLLFAPALFSVVGTTIVGLFGRSYDQLGFMVTL